VAIATNINRHIKITFCSAMSFLQIDATRGQ
jgi:hypothetical protein